MVDVNAVRDILGWVIAFLSALGILPFLQVVVLIIVISSFVSSMRR